MKDTRQRPLCHGFTLFELLLVLAILATTAVLVAPRLGPSVKSEIDAAIRIVSAGLRQARSQAVTTGKEVVFVVDLNRKRFELRVDLGVDLGLGKTAEQGGEPGAERGGDSSSEPRAARRAAQPRWVAKRLPTRVDYRIVTAEQERFSETVAGVRFYPDGTSTGGRVSAVAGKHERFVDIDWLTGKIRASRLNAG